MMKQRLEVYLEPSRASTMELFCENIFTKKGSIVDVPMSSK